MSSFYREVEYGGFWTDPSGNKIVLAKVEPDIVRILIRDAEAAYRDFEMAMDRILAVFGRNDDS